MNDAMYNVYVRINFPHVVKGFLCPVRAATPSLQMGTQFGQENLLKWYGYSQPWTSYNPVCEWLTHNEIFMNVFFKAESYKHK
jgi:hypothetical protein